MNDLPADRPADLPADRPDFIERGSHSSMHPLDPEFRVRWYRSGEPCWVTGTRFVFKVRS